MMALLKYAFASRKARMDESLEEAARYGISVAEEYRQMMARRGIDLAGCNLLELGPGSNLVTPLLLAAMGARVSAADRFIANWRDEHAPLYRLLLERFDGDGAPIRRALDLRCFDNAMRLIPEPAENMASIPTASQDVVVSNAVLEHLYDLEAAAAELWRVSRPGCWQFHQIDLRDHKDYARPLESLLWPRDIYREKQEKVRYERGCQWRASEFKVAFEAQGFQMREIEVNGLATDAYMDDFEARLPQYPASPYQGWPREDLRIVSARFVLFRAE